jgi:hypothetical protein
MVLMWASRAVFDARTVTPARTGSVADLAASDKVVGNGSGLRWSLSPPWPFPGPSAGNTMVVVREVR